MSKSNKTNSRLERLKNRRGVRAANQHRYESQMANGSNSKKASRIRRRQYNFTKHTHTVPDCGNIGCLRCSQAAMQGKYNLFARIHGEEAARRMMVKRTGSAYTLHAM